MSRFHQRKYVRHSLVLFSILCKGQQMTKISRLQILIKNLEGSSVRLLYYSEILQGSIIVFFLTCLRKTSKFHLISCCEEISTPGK